ncbi:MAG: ROK family protein [Mesorhizobium sp.]|nr:MAG: ROK family protein [Mesorhizobium sp.]TIX28346.1 MAG: ROK family protein [Mesorhizobium sp.]
MVQFWCCRKSGRYGSATATQLVKSTGLARSTVSTLLSELKDGRIVLDLDTKSNGFGRPSQLLSLNPGTGRCAGVLLGLGEIRIVICDLAHTVLSDVWFEMRRDYTPEEAAGQIKDNLTRQCASLGLAIKDLLGVGLAISAPLSYDGRVLNGDVLPTWGGVDLAAIFSKHLDCPLHAENESHCGALAEMTWGAAIGEKDFVLYKFDLGAIVRDGVVQRGFNGSAAEFGHIVLDPQGSLCRCGNRGCLQTFAGGYHLMQHAEKFGGQPVTIDQFIERTREGRLGYSRLIEDAAEKAGWGMGITASILNPPLFIIVGKLATIGRLSLIHWSAVSRATRFLHPIRSPTCRDRVCHRKVPR